MKLTATKLGGLVLAGVLAFGPGSMLEAATVSFSALIPSTLNPLADTKSAGVIENNPTDQVSVRLGPRGNNVAPYTSVDGGGFASYKLGMADALTFVWGTPDTYNFLDFYLNNVLVDTVGGFGSGSNVGAPTATVTNIVGGFFNRVVFRSDQIAFEYDSVSVNAVPVPAAGGLLLLGLGGLGLLMRRKSSV